ncbi:hypothetical protein AF335_21345 [Streptomyces eurocidicus]|uniref:Ricin B lectin domain-containing protein n=1 Tax=Streptomyces eurocidicus TaxID=66423 RepID=A0A2N8NU07_STREU|nr:RICIN domain-containing protein [Streptomyces eurocidicus]MBB5119267.1 hypothetical protein [Streptomyces eurocidicus]PNE32245.1 hypothetical protein AF335_21345 [Streptomyces eurocidicus]
MPSPSLSSSRPGVRSRALVVLLAAMALLVLGPGYRAPARAAPQQEVNILAAHSGKCLEVASAAVGEPVRQQRCVGSPRALWYLRASEAGGGTVNIVNAYSGKCLEVENSSPANGAAVRQGDCTGRPGADFALVDAGDNAWLQPSTASPRKCVEVTGSALEDGVPLRQWDCARQPGAEFVQRSDPVRETTLVNVNSGKCLGIEGHGPADGAKVVQLTCSGAALDQKWQVGATASGAVTLTNVSTGKCLSIEGASTENGALGVQTTCAGTPEQGWLARPQGTGFHALVNVNSAKFLGIKSVSSEEGAETDQWTDSGTRDQLWQMVPSAVRVVKEMM